MECTITGIHAYPVKSCRGSAVESARITPTGMEGDRQLMVVRDRAFVNQARLAALARISTRRIDADRVEFGNPGGAAVELAIGDDGERFDIDYFGERVTVVDQGDAVAAFLSEEIGANLRAVALDAPFVRRLPLEEFALIDGEEQARFTDVAPILVTNEATLDDLNGRLETPVPMARFRPNIVVSGLEAFAEDELSALEGSGFSLLRATWCERCATTCTDQETGERTEEPLATLKSYRHRENGYAGGVLFGAYMAVTGEGTVRVGDRLRVLGPAA